MFMRCQTSTNGDHVAHDPPADLADEVDARLAGKLAAEDGRRPRQRERAALDRRHSLEVGEVHRPHETLAAAIVGHGFERHCAPPEDAGRAPLPPPAQRAASGARP
jgi:hypothetical protein